MPFESRLLKSVLLGGPKRSAAAGAVFLLDTYPNAGFAFSFRKLRNAYAGSAVRIRRSSDSTEQDFGFDGSGDFDAAGVATFIGAGTGFIVTWYDQSGNGLDVTQSTVGNQPDYNASTFLSTPSILFGGGALGTLGDVLLRANVDYTAFHSGSACTVMAVMQQDGAQAQHTIFGWDGGDTTNQFICHATYDNVIYFDVGGTGVTGRSSVAQPTGWDSAPHLLELYRDTSDVQGIVVDGTSLNTTSRGQDLVSDSDEVLAVGNFGESGVGTVPFKGYLTELISWVTDLGTTNRAAARTAINGYYGVF